MAFVNKVSDTKAVRREGVACAFCGKDAVRELSVDMPNHAITKKVIQFMQSWGGTASFKTSEQAAVLTLGGCLHHTYDLEAMRTDIVLNNAITEDMLCKCMTKARRFESER
jgi:hypothetical protein